MTTSVAKYRSGLVPRVVIVGGGFGGLTTAQTLDGAPVWVTLIDRTNHHLFQPLLYQVAMAGLSPAEIAWPIRSALRKEKNAEVILGQVERVDLASRTLHLYPPREVSYDFLVLAVGGRTSYYGHKEWESFAPGLKDLDDAVEIRRRVLLAFEAAERETDPGIVRRLLTFVVVGGGPTGVELAGALSELARFVLNRDFRRINLKDTRVLLLEGGPQILPSFPEPLPARAIQQLNGLGVEVRVNARVTGIDAQGVHLGDELIPSATVIWGAGVEASPLTRTLGVPLDRAGRVLVEPDLTIPGHPDVFVIGDASVFLHQDGKPLPGVSPVAMQMGRTVARNIRHQIEGRPMETFHYVDKGSMATIGRKAAVAVLGKLKLTGLIAWLAWMAVHIFFLIGFRNRLAVMIDWAWSYFTYQRGARLITGHALEPGSPSIPTEQGRLASGPGPLLPDSPQASPALSAPAEPPQKT